MNSPVVLFAYNRPDALKGAIASLRSSRLAPETDLYLFVDGPKGEEDAAKQQKIHEVVEGLQGFNRVQIRFSETHRGLADSVISGVSEVLERSDRVIVLEDDLKVTPDFLEWMNAALDKYAASGEVFSVCGYSNRVRMPEGYRFDGYFGPRNASWGWGVWKDRWASVDWNPSPSSMERNRHAFNRWGGSDCYSMLKAWSEKRNDSWAIRFNFSEFLQNRLSFFPVMSHVDPTGGFDGSGTHCGRYSRFKFDLTPAGRQAPYLLPDHVEVLPVVRKRVLSYHSLAARAFSRLMYLFHG